MPTINEIQIELQCQQHISSGGPVEEFAPRPRAASDASDLFMPDLYDHEANVCSVFIPIFPRAQFFLKYQIEPPARQASTAYNEFGRPSKESLKPYDFLVFQLFIGKDEITTWSCGNKQAWQGRACFAIYATSKSELPNDGKTFEKRIFMFNGDLRVTGDMQCDKDRDRKIEVRVFRANKAMRLPRQPDRYEGQGMTDEVRTPKGGAISEMDPRKFYKFGLLDPSDKPYATFRWFYRSWGKISTSGVSSSEANELPDEIHKLELRLGEAESAQAASIFAGFEVMKPPRTKIISIASGIISRGDAQTPLRYDFASGSFVQMKSPNPLPGGPNRTSNESDETRNRDSSNVRQSLLHAKVLSTYQEAQVKAPRLMVKDPSRSKSGLIQIPAALLLPPKHPHAQPLPLARHSYKQSTSSSSKDRTFKAFTSTENVRPIE